MYHKFVEVKRGASWIKTTSMMRNNSQLFILLRNAVVCILTCAASSCSSTPVDKIMPASEEGVHFQKGNLSLAFVKAKAQHKPVCIFAYGKYCSYCKKMKRAVFPENDIATGLNNNFISMQVDVDSDEGKRITDQFHIALTPAIIFLNPAGKMIRQLNGFQTKEELLTAIQFAGNAPLAGTNFLPLKIVPVDHASVTVL